MRKTTKQADDLFEFITNLYFAYRKNYIKLFSVLYFDPYCCKSRAEEIRELIKKALYLVGYRDRSLSDKVVVLTKAFLRANAENITTKDDWLDTMDKNGGIYMYGKTYKQSKKVKTMESFYTNIENLNPIYHIEEVNQSLVNINKTKNVFKGWK